MEAPREYRCGDVYRLKFLRLSPQRFEIREYNPTTDAVDLRVNEGRGSVSFWVPASFLREHCEFERSDDPEAKTEPADEYQVTGQTAEAFLKKIDAATPEEKEAKKDPMVGMVVKLKSGGPKMTVIAAKINECEVAWFADNESYGGKFPVFALVEAE